MSSEMLIEVKQNPGMVSFDNYESVKADLSNRLEFYTKVDYSKESIDSIKSDRDSLKQMKKEISDAKKRITEAYNAPLKDVVSKLDDLEAMVKEPFNQLDKMVKDSESAAKKAAIEDYAKEKSEKLGGYADKIINSPSFFNPKWLQTSYKPKQWKEDIDNIVDSAQRDINFILRTGGEQQRVMLARYYDTLSIDGMADFISNIDSGENEMLDDVTDSPVGYKIIKVNGNAHQMMQLFMNMDLLDLEYEEIEDGMPTDMNERIAPEFDSFVSFDIEHTGTLGSAKGDAESEIIEIGAVKVRNGVIVDSFDELINPCRKIVPRIAKLTGISDEMLIDKPKVEEVIQRFKEFVGDDILIGHNIKGCDIPHIQRAARKIGFKFSNDYLDTKALASKVLKGGAVENYKLITLLAHYGINQDNAHRASSDAEVTAQLYLKLKEESIY